MIDQPHSGVMVSPHLCADEACWCRRQPAITPTWVSDCGTVSLWLGCAEDVLLTWPDGVVDALITDPPYSSGGAFRGDRMVDSRTKYVSTGTEHNLQAFSGDNRDQRSYLAWTAMWLRLATHVCRSGALCSVFSDWRQLPTTTDAIQAGGWVWRGIAVWPKVNARPTLGRYTNQCEFVPWGTNGPREVAGYAARGWCHVGSVSNGERQHITEKPTEVMEWLLSPVEEGGLVADPFMGSGSTGVAAVQSQRRFWGVEMNPNNFSIAVRRIEAELNRYPLLEPKLAAVQSDLFAEDA